MSKTYKEQIKQDVKDFANELAGKKKPTWPVGGKIKNEEESEGKIVLCTECGKEKKLIDIGFVSNTKRICDKCLKKDNDKV